MTRGNQREIDRQRAMNRHAGKGKTSDGDPEKRRIEDGLKLQAKIAAKKAKEAVEKEESEARAKYDAGRHGEIEGANSTLAASTSTTDAEVPAAVSHELTTQKQRKKVKEDLSFLSNVAKEAPK